VRNNGNRIHIEQHFDKISDVTVDGSPRSGEREPGEYEKGTIIYNSRISSGIPIELELELCAVY